MLESKPKTNCAPARSGCCSALTSGCVRGRRWCLCYCSVLLFSPCGCECCCLSLVSSTEAGLRNYLCTYESRCSCNTERNKYNSNQILLYIYTIIFLTILTRRALLMAGQSGSGPKYKRPTKRERKKRDNKEKKRANR